MGDKLYVLDMKGVMRIIQVARVQGTGQERAGRGMLCVARLRGGSHLHPRDRESLLHRADAMMEELDLTFIEETVKRVGVGKEKVLEILQAIQGHYGYLPDEALRRVCELTEITPASIAGVSTFYDQFRHRPAGKHIIHVCIGTACHVKARRGGLRRISRAPGDCRGRRQLDAQRQFTNERIACLGCCTLAPAVQIDDVTYGHLTRETVPGVLRDFLQHKRTAAASSAKCHGLRKGKTPPRGEVRIGLGSCCVARGSGKLHEALEEALARTGVQVPVKRVGCVGMCHQTPLLEIVLPNQSSFLYARVEPQDAKEIVQRHFGVRGPHRKFSTGLSKALDHLLTDEKWEPVTRYSIHVRDQAVSDFLGRQIHIATEHCGHIDPTDLDEYQPQRWIQRPGKGDPRAPPEAVIKQIEISGLRGRGGAGFPTHLKWSAVRATESAKKYVVCNGDEGDPAAFMDRMLMESYPYRIIEGMVIAARCVGAHEGFLYIRAEYPLAIKRVTEALEKCRERGFLGDRILGTDFSLDLKIVAKRGGVCLWEETGAHGKHRGASRHAQTKAPVSGRRRGFGGSPRSSITSRRMRASPDSTKWGRVFRSHRRGKEQGNEGFRSGGQDRSGLDRGAHGDFDSPDHRRDRRRHRRRAEVQGGPSGRPLRRMHPSLLGTISRSITSPHGSRGHDGFRRLGRAR